MSFKLHDKKKKMYKVCQDIDIRLHQNFSFMCPVLLLDLKMISVSCMFQARRRLDTF